jgi:membrane protease YdiL (CAAX protease family)
MDLFKRISLIWWLRIMFYIILSFLLYLLLIEILPYELIYLQIHLAIALLIPVFFIESQRFKIYRTYFGLSISKKSIKNFLLGGLLALFVMMNLLILMYLFNLKISINEGISFQKILYNLVLFFFIAFTEELIFRGVVFQTLLYKFNHNIVIILFSLFFSFLHIANPNSGFISTLNIFIAGLIFGFLFLKKLDLWYCISFHFFWNFLQVLLLNSSVSGYRFDFNIININYNNVNNKIQLLTGNQFGVEAGLITTFLLLFILFNVIYIMKPDFNLHKKNIKRKMMEKYKMNMIRNKRN